MRNSIDRMINKVLEEEIQKKLQKFLNEDKDEWMEIDGTIDEMDIDEEDMGEEENLESREFVYAARKAKEQGKKSFELDGKKFDVKEKMEKLHHSLENVSENKLIEFRSKLINKKYPTTRDRRLLENVESALKLKRLNTDSGKLRFTETELIDLIESVILEKKSEKPTQLSNLKEQELETFIRRIVQNRIDEVTDLDNMDKKIPFGLSKTQKAQRETKKENDEYSKEVVKKMKEYLKDGSKGEYSENPDSFPKGNGEMGEMDRKAYKASDAVEEYIEAFAYPGLENTRYDEIHPQEEWVKKNIVGSSETGNNPKWANAVDTELGERINKKREENLYQKEKDRSYKRVSQPVDRAGENKGDKKLDDIFTKLESEENKKQKLVNEEMNKMKNLINYNQKTQ